LPKPQLPHRLTGDATPVEQFGRALFLLGFLGSIAAGWVAYARW